MHFVRCRRMDTLTGTRLWTPREALSRLGKGDPAPVGPRPRLLPRPVV